MIKNDLNKTEILKIGMNMKCYRNNDDVIDKVYYDNSQFFREVYKTMMGDYGIEAILNYINILKKLDVDIAPLLSVDNQNGKIVIRQKYVKGCLLNDLEKENVKNRNDDLLKKYYHQLLLIQKRVISSKFQIGIDLNTQNFVIENEKMILVDITPPLFKKRVPNNANEIMKYYYNSFFDRDTQLLAIWGYLLKPIIFNENIINNNVKQMIIQYNNMFFELVETIWSKADKESLVNNCLNMWRDSKVDVYSKRIRCAYDYINDKITLEELRNTYKLTSFVNLISFYKGEKTDV